MGQQSKAQAIALWAAGFILLTTIVCCSGLNLWFSRGDRSAPPRPKTDWTRHQDTFDVLLAPPGSEVLRRWHPNDDLANIAVEVSVPGVRTEEFYREYCTDLAATIEGTGVFNVYSSPQGYRDYRRLDKAMAVGADLVPFRDRHSSTKSLIAGYEAILSDEELERAHGHPDWPIASDDEKVELLKQAGGTAFRTDHILHFVTSRGAGELRWLQEEGDLAHLMGKSLDVSVD